MIKSKLPAGARQAGARLAHLELQLLLLLSIAPDLQGSIVGQARAERQSCADCGSDASEAAQALGGRNRTVHHESNSRRCCICTCLCAVAGGAAGALCRLPGLLATAAEVAPRAA